MVNKQISKQDAINSCGMSVSEAFYIATTQIRDHSDTNYALYRDEASNVILEALNSAIPKPVTKHSAAYAAKARSFFQQLGLTVEDVVFANGESCSVHLSRNIDFATAISKLSTEYGMPATLAKLYEKGERLAYNLASFFVYIEGNNLGSVHVMQHVRAGLGSDTLLVRLHNGPVDHDEELRQQSKAFIESYAKDNEPDPEPWPDEHDQTNPALEARAATVDPIETADLHSDLFSTPAEVRKVPTSTAPFYARINRSRPE